MTKEEFEKNWKYSEERMKRDPEYREAVENLSKQIRDQIDKDILKHIVEDNK